MSNFLLLSALPFLGVAPPSLVFFNLNFKGIARNLNGGQSTSEKGRNGAMAYSIPN